MEKHQVENGVRILERIEYIKSLKVECEKMGFSSYLSFKEWKASEIARLEKELSEL